MRYIKLFEVSKNGWEKQTSDEIQTFKNWRRETGKGVQRFTYSEIKKIFKVVPQKYIDQTKQMGCRYLDKRHKYESIVIGFGGFSNMFLCISKYDDGWFTVLLVPEKSDVRYNYKVDQLDGLLDLLVKIYKRSEYYQKLRDKSIT